MVVALLRPSSSSLLFRHCLFSLFPLLPLSTTFFSLYNGFVEVLVVANWGGAAKVVDLSSFSSLCFFSALFCLLLSALLHCFYPFASLLLLPMGGGAWPFLVGGAICLVNSVNERDLSLLTSYAEVTLRGQLLRGTMAFQAKEV